MTKAYRPIPAEEVIARLPAEVRARIKARAAELIAEEIGRQCQAIAAHDPGDDKIMESLEGAQDWSAL